MQAQPVLSARSSRSMATRRKRVSAPAVVVEAAKAERPDHEGSHPFGAERSAREVDPGVDRIEGRPPYRSPISTLHGSRRAAPTGRAASLVKAGDPTNTGRTGGRAEVGPTIRNARARRVWTMTIDRMRSSPIRGQTHGRVDGPYTGTKTNDASGRRSLLTSRRLFARIGRSRSTVWSRSRPPTTDWNAIDINEPGDVRDAQRSGRQGHPVKPDPPVPGAPGRPTRSTRRRLHKHDAGDGRAPVGPEESRKHDGRKLRWRPRTRFWP